MSDCYVFRIDYGSQYNLIRDELFQHANCARDGVQMVCSLLVKLVVLNVVGKNDGGMKMNVM